MHLLFVHRSTYVVQYILFYLYRLLLPLILSIFLYLYHSTLLLLSDPHTAWIDSTFSICLGTQLQIHLLLCTERTGVSYSKILYPLLSSKESKHKLDNRLFDWLANPCTTWVSPFISFLKTWYIPIHACYRINHDLIQSLTDSATVASSTDLLSSSHRLSFLF